MSKQDKLAVFAKFVDNLKDVSKCEDRHTAAIVCSKDLQQIYSIGVNGGPKDTEHRDPQLSCLCNTEVKYSCIHAEANALIKLQTSATEKIMICSLAPCTQCASMIVNTPGGFSEVLYLTQWKEPLALDILISRGIKVGHLSLDGKVDYIYNGWGMVDTLAKLRGEQK